MQLLPRLRTRLTHQSISRRPNDAAGLPWCRPSVARCGVLLMVAVLLILAGCSKEHDKPTLSGSHPDTWMDPVSADFHGDVVLDRGGQSCAVCHGRDWKGGETEVSCVTCHAERENACTDCHGGLNNMFGAPPYGLEDETADTTLAVGKHTVHVGGSALAAGYGCENCHRAVTFVLDPWHLDFDFAEQLGVTDSVAEITWGGVAGEVAGWDRVTATCVGTYCHGNFDGGDTANVAVWTTGQAPCGSCHDTGDDPASLKGPHYLHLETLGLSCVDCHSGVVNASKEIINPALHVNGIADTVWSNNDFCNNCHGEGPDVCLRCHGGIDNETGAPPVGLRGETSTGELAVGAHTAHVAGGNFADAFDCTACHLKPENVASPGHYDVDSVAEITWGDISGAGSTWNRTPATCASTYCHGNFTGGNPSNTPVWTSGEAVCGSCHNVGDDPALLEWEHEFHVTSLGFKCEDCHAAVVDASLNIIDLGLHVNGVADTLIRDQAQCALCHAPGDDLCYRCHGGIDNETGAPPVGLEGETLTSQLAVGAHTAHVAGGNFADAFDCTECHLKPLTVADAGHYDLNSIAEITWGGIAGTSSVWNRTGATCSATYCHGNFSGGTSGNTPVWTGGEASCGSCHDTGSDPAALGGIHDLHVSRYSLECQDCHASVVDGSLNIIGLNRHVNGAVDTLTRDAALCAECHGSTPDVCVRCHGGIDNQTGAPPVGLEGETLPTLLAVGAHTAHISGGSTADAFDCVECHIKPTSITDPGHYDSGWVAEITWGGIAGANADWDRVAATCALTYCHGNFSGGTSANTPVWTGGAASCGSCHDTGSDPASLGGIHEVHVSYFSFECRDCHASVVDGSLNIIGLDLHVNAVPDTLPRDTALCSPCHGTGPDRCARCHGGTDNLTGAPPVGLEGETLTTQLAVGAHTAHIQGGTLADAFDCTECHLKPENVADSGHYELDSIAEITWGGIAGASSTWDRLAATCALTYCHGNFTGGTVANTPVWTSGLAICGSCHDTGANPLLLGGKHRRHVQQEDIGCYQCHALTVDVTKTVIGLDMHVNGTNNVRFEPNIGTYSPSTRTCTDAGGCHDETKVW